MQRFALSNDDTGHQEAVSRHAEFASLASELLATERYLSGAEMQFLERVAAGGEADLRRFREIAANHGRYI